MKVLVLTCNTGTGFNAAGRALYEEFHSQNIPCEYRDIFSFVPEKQRKKAAERAAHIYSSMIMPASGIFHPVHSVRKTTHPRRKSQIHRLNALYADALCDYLLEQSIDTVITPHIFPACALSELKKQKLLAASFYALVTQYDALDAWRDTDPDYLIVPHQDQVRSFMKLGLRHDVIYPLGIPLPVTYSMHRSRDEARHMLDLPPDGKLILVMANALPFAQIRKMVPVLRRIYGSRLLMVFLSDPNHVMNTHLMHFVQKDDRLIVRDHSDDFGVYLDASDVFISRPNGLFAVEAAAKQVPAILVNPLPGLEEKNADFLSRHHMASLITHPSDLMIELQALIENDAHRHHLIENQQEMIHPEDAARIAYFIINSSRE